LIAWGMVLRLSEANKDSKNEVKKSPLMWDWEWSMGEEKMEALKVVANWKEKAPTTPCYPRHRELMNEACTAWVDRRRSWVSLT